MALCLAVLCDWFKNLAQHAPFNPNIIVSQQSEAELQNIMIKLQRVFPGLVHVTNLSRLAQWAFPHFTLVVGFPALGTSNVFPRLAPAARSHFEFRLIFVLFAFDSIGREVIFKNKFCISPNTFYLC